MAIGGAKILADHVLFSATIRQRSGPKYHFIYKLDPFLWVDLVIMTQA